MRGEGSPAEMDPAPMEKAVGDLLRSEEERITAEMNALQERLGDLTGLVPFERRRSSLATRLPSRFRQGRPDGEAGSVDDQLAAFVLEAVGRLGMRIDALLVGPELIRLLAVTGSASREPEPPVDADLLTQLLTRKDR